MYVFYSELRLLFLLELHQTLLLIHFALKQKMEKSEFLTKSFGEMPILGFHC